ncbi:hypothetical protein ACZ90_48925 [Streptomyces albus subsp. albus]|nr:hypothetical protein ACZ90_48925 [Streptomyces albus subsp. albus]
MTDRHLGRTPGQRIRHDEDGYLVLPMRIARKEVLVAASELVLTVAEAEWLHAALCYALDGKPVPDFAPDCRYPVQRSPGTRHL